MDIYCPVCGEPWEMDSLHEEAQERYGIPYYIYNEAWTHNLAGATRTKNPQWDEAAYSAIYEKVRSEFQIEGCKALKALTEAKYCEPNEEGGERAMLAAAAYEILGDDMDGAASMLDDWC